MRSAPHQVALDPAQSALFVPLYPLPAGSITVALDELAPSIYPDAMITGRSSWYMMANAVSGQLAMRRGLAADHDANSAPGPDGSTIWVSGLGGYDSVSAGGGRRVRRRQAAGRAGIDVPVAGTARVRVAIGTVEGHTWSQASGNATSSTAQLVTYGQWQNGVFFARRGFGMMYQQENVNRSLPVFSAATRGDANGLAGGGGLHVGVQQQFGAWLHRTEPRLRRFPSAPGQCGRERWSAGGEHDGPRWAAPRARSRSLRNAASG